MSKTRLGVRTGEALDRRILDFFRANPDEELTIEDVAAKFDTSWHYAADMVRMLRERGDLEYVRVARLPERER